MNIPTLADALAGRTEVAPGPAPSRVHLLKDDDPPRTRKRHNESEARRDDTREAPGRADPACPPQPATSVVTPSIRPFFNPPKEEAMPRGVYTRKKRKQQTENETAPEAAAPKRSGRARRAPAEGAPTFGIFSDGTVAIKAAKCAGELTGAEAKQLADFLARIGVKT